MRDSSPRPADASSGPGPHLGTPLPIPEPWIPAILAGMAALLPILVLLQFPPGAPPAAEVAPIERFATGTARSTPTADILVIVLDDFGVEGLSVTPAIRELAAQGRSYTRAYSMPVCSSSRFAAMFAWLPRRYGVGDIFNTYQPMQTPSPYSPCSLLSIPEVLKPEGYATVLIGKWHLGRCGNLLGNLFQVEDSAFVQGFDRVRQMSPDSVGFGGGTGYYSWDRVNDGNRNITTLYATDLQADEFLTMWAATPSPRFFWLSFSAPHSPYDTPPGYPAPTSTREAYEFVLEYADTRIADVLAAVDLSETYVLLFGDNGTPDDARPIGSPSGQWKGTTREGGIRIPMILAGPGIAPGEDARLVSVLDVAPTICDLVGLAWNGGQDGVSMLSSARSWVVAERFRLHPNLPAGTLVDDVAVIEHDWKLRVFDADGPGPALSVEEFYWLGGGTVERRLTPAATVRQRLRTVLANLPPRGP